MKAITYSRYGSPEVLEVRNVGAPRPGDEDLLIRVRAAEATKADCEMRGFRFAVKWFWLPLRLAAGIWRPRKQILGGYFAGEIESTGKHVTGFSAGDDVFGCTGINFGAYGELLALPADGPVATKPAKLSFAEAAAVPLGGLNALHFMRLAGIEPGDQVLINGAGGSIGAHAVQIAKAMGAEVTAVDSGIKAEMLRRLGADHFFDYRTEAFPPAGHDYDVVFDMVANSSYAACVGALKSGGRYLCGNPRLSVMLRSVLTNRFSDKTAGFAFARETREELEDLNRLIEDGKIVSIVDRVYPMEQAAEAHRRVETEQRRGAVVLIIDGAH